MKKEYISKSRKD